MSTEPRAPTAARRAREGGGAGAAARGKSPGAAARGGSGRGTTRRPLGSGVPRVAADIDRTTTLVPVNYSLLWVVAEEGGQEALKPDH